MADNRKLLVEGYSAKPKAGDEPRTQGMQASSSPSSQPPSGDSLPKNQLSAVKPPKK